MLIDLSINPSQTTEHIVNFIKTTVQNAGFARVVLGLSGGIDSATSCILATRALKPENVYIGILPYGLLNKQGEEDAYLVAQTAQIPQENIQKFDIAPLVDPVVQTDASMDDLRKGNIMVRMRMIFLYDLSKKFNTLVLGTENKTEHLLGYFTRFGDEASDIEPIRSLYKTQVRQLASYLGVPEKISTKAPTAGMWQGQTDEKEFGFSYDDADQILSLAVDQKKTKEEIMTRGFEQKVVDAVFKRMKDNEFKHTLPYTL